MPASSPPATLPPGARRFVRRLELGLLLAVVCLLVLLGLTWSVGLLGRVEEPPADAARPRRELRPLVADFRGAVEYRPLGAPDWRPLRWSDAFREGDRLRVAADSTCDVLLTWGTGVRFMPGSEAVWRLLERRGAARAIELELRRGRVLASLDRLPPGSRFEVVTPHSRARVRGTVLSVSADDDQTSVTVLSGVVDVIDTSDPARRVTATAGTGVESGGEGRLRPLSAEERARLLGEMMEVDERVGRLSPSAPQVTERPAVDSEGADPTSPDADAPPRLEAVEVTAAPAPADRRGDAEVVTDLLRAGLALLDQGNVEAALAYCTPSFRAVLWSPMAVEAGIASEVSRELGDRAVLLERDKVREAMHLRLLVTDVEVKVDGDVAYGNAVVTALAQPKGTSDVVGRVFGCSARCLRQPDGRWLVDLATATESREVPRGP